MPKHYTITLKLTPEQLENLEAAVRSNDGSSGFAGGGYPTEVRNTLRAKVGAAAAYAREGAAEPEQLDRAGLLQQELDRG